MSENHIDVPLDGRTFERTQGCWNCKHRADIETSLTFWLKNERPKHDARIRDLKLAIAAIDPLRKIELEKRMTQLNQVCKVVDDFEDSIKTGHKYLGFQALCTRTTSPKHGEFTAHNFLCDRWDAAIGASVARAGAKLDLLPEELKDIHGDGN